MGKIILDVFTKETMIIRLLTISIIILTFVPSYSFAEVFNVTNEEVLRQALNTAASNNQNDVINISAGTYNTSGETFTYSTEEDFSLTMVGEGADLTILSGGGQGQVLQITNLTSNPSEAQLSIRELTIAGGSSNEGCALLVGGFKDLTIEHCTIDGNESAGGAGGFCVGGQNVALSNNVIRGNGTLTGRGGGGSIFGNQVMLVNNTFKNNGAEREGGGAAISGGIVTLINNEFTDNSVRDEGGGVRISANILNLTSNRFTDNRSELVGGGASIFIGNDGQASLINNIFEKNFSGHQGGGLDIHVSSLSLTNNTFTLNTAQIGNGGGVFISSGNVNIYNNILFNNIAAEEGDDIFIDDESSTNNIGSNVMLFNNDFSDFFSVCENTEGCEPNINEGNNIDEDPLFVDSPARDVRLQAGSPAIDAGDPNAPDLPTTDFFGNPRISPPDMGAVEFIPSTNGGECSGSECEPGDANGDGEINILDVTVILNDILEISSAPGNGDCNEDGEVNILDVTCVLNIILQG